ncbi:MAG: ThuA domain-containing protein [Planctomycetaceae bacterium]|jgi:type 1 glutamine amidotransferase|nr:ThuA domain-containing protein [Planctomycetaceae bacterium]
MKIRELGTTHFGILENEDSTKSEIIKKLNQNKTFMKKSNVLILLLAVLMVPSVSVVLFGQDHTTNKKIRVLLITGEDHPSHHWQETAPVVRGGLNTAKDIDCRLVDDPEILATEVIFDYDVLIFHFKNYKPLKRHEQAKQNLLKFTNNGGGLVLIHFACGAFDDWAEFEKLAGRIYDPKKRGHDPYGRFKVEYIDHEHPVSDGLENFEIEDELYTCLKDSSVPVRVLAESESKVDKKRHSMAFVREHGNSRIFLTTLGHDVKAVSSPGFKSILQRAVRWTAKKIDREPQQSQSGM